MAKVLIITYYWPPGSGPGVQRWLKFCKYLPDFEWEPVVITVKNGSYPSTDESLLDDIPEDLRVIKTSTLEPFAIYNSLRGKKGKSVEVGMGNIKGKTSWFARLSNYVRANFFVPDARVGWNIYSLPEALKVIKKENPDVLITSGPPHSTHLVGERLQRELGINWIADMRDPWVNIYYNAFLNRTPSTTERDQKLEDMVLRQADGVITASPGLQKEFEDRAKKITVIPNGYDEGDILHLNPKPRSSFTLAYVGNLKAVQDLPTLWKAIQELAAEDASFKQDFRFQITGNISDEIRESLLASDIMDQVEILPFVPHLEAIERMLSSHVLLLPIPNQKGNEVILTGKLFEYLATRRPILSIGPILGNAAMILKDCEKEPMLDYEDLSGMKRMLKSMHEEFKVHHAPLVTGNNVYRKFSRKGTTEQLSEFLNEVLS